MSGSSVTDSIDPCLVGGGEAGALLRSIDWSKNPLGAPSGWPTTLRTTVGIMLASRFAMRILWGPELIFLHNDAYRPVLGASKYPGAMGKRTEDSFPELWPVVGPMFRRVMAGEAVSLVDGILPLDRYGYLEECFFTLSYSPLSDDHGGIGGVLGIVYETTERVIAERRLRALRQLAAGLAGVKTPERVCQVTRDVFAEATEDVPFALLYLREGDPRAARLVAWNGLGDCPAARPERLPLGSSGPGAGGRWPLAAPVPGARFWLVEDVGTRFGPLHGGPYPEPITGAIVLSLERPGADSPYGYLVAGLNPRRAFDADYQAFYELAGEHIASAIANAAATAHAESQRQFLEGVINQMPAGIVIAEAPSGKPVLSNALADSILGRATLPAGSMQQFAAYPAFHPDGRPYTTAELPLMRALHGDRVLDEEVEFVRGPGDRRILSVNSAPIYDVDGRLVAGVSSFADVTDRKRTERALRDSEERGRAIVAALEEGIVLRGVDGTIQFANASAERLLGLTRDQLASRVLADPRWRAVREDGSAYPAEEHVPMRALREGRPLSNEIMGVHAPDGRLIWLSINAQPLFGPDGKVAGVVSSFFDITERKTAEEERQVLLARAERARQASESASRAKDEFLAIVSHELRNPLNAILGWTRLLRTGTFSAERAARALETIERNAVSQAQLVEDLLDVSRVISGKLPLDVKTVSLSRIVEAAVDSARPAIEAKGLRLSLVLDTDSVLSGDPGRLQQIVWNLLTNATKFTPRGGAIHIVLRRDDSHLELAVTDSGQGIAPDFLGQIFDRFKQADSSTTRQHGGLGLGLAIARNLVEMHGGTIEARSGGLGQGAAFIVRVPVAAVRRAAVPQVPHRATESPVTFQRPPELDGLRILVVDDEPDARDVVTAVLSECGAVVRTAPSAALALSAVESEAPDVLLCDIGMPLEDGYSLIARVRALPAAQGGQTPAACLTGYTTADDRRRALQAGFNMHLAKPIEPTELIAVVANLSRLAKALQGCVP